MARKKRFQHVVEFRVDDETYRELIKTSEELRTTVSDIVRMAVRLYLNHLASIKQQRQVQ